MKFPSEKPCALSPRNRNKGCAMTEPAPALCPPATAPPLLVDAVEAARLLGISRALLYSMAADGRLGPMSVAFGRRKLWRAAELAAWVAHDPPCPCRTDWMKRDRHD